MAHQLIRAAATAAALGLLGGCVILSASVRSGELLPDGRLASLKDGVSTSAQVVEAFGPPLRVARRGDGPVGAPDLFAPFGGVPPAAADVAWWYHAERSGERWTGLGVLRADVAEGTSYRQASDDLWLLLDGETGRLRAHVHRRWESQDPERRDSARRGEADPWSPGATQ
ncbi:MAG: hypothetical protein IPO09_13535 [Anaeromyxobacter sp.]|nr:hypothetical protein [Anaeromyxobacter sp.]